MNIQRILLPTDFSDLGEQAKAFAFELTERFDAELHVLHVLEVHLSPMPQFFMGLAPPTKIEESERIVRNSLEELISPSWMEQHSVVLATAKGPPFVEIIRYARANNIDLIVMGTHGRSGLTHALIGSVAERVVRKAPCPVLTVCPKAREFVMP